MIPVWRLRQIRNIADTVAYRAACCPFATVLMVTEAELLKPEAHIHLVINPSLEAGEAQNYIVFTDASHALSKSPVRLIRVIIYFSGDLTTKEGWEKAARAVAEQLAWVAFFSEAAKRQVLCATQAEQQQVVSAFVEVIMRERCFEFEATRPRFTLAKLRQIVRHDLHRAAKTVEPHVQSLLLPYLGPDGW